MTKVNGMSLENYIWNQYKGRIASYYKQYNVCSFFTKDIKDAEVMSCGICKYEKNKNVCPKLK
jgi:hypothetical protein